jgi:hypothetical protein
MISVTGSCRKDAGKSPDSAGKHWKSLEHGSSIPNGLVRWILVNFHCFPVGTGRKSSEKSRKFPAGILLPQNDRKYREPAVSWPVCSTWGVKRCKYRANVTSSKDLEKWVRQTFGIRNNTIFRLRGENGVVFILSPIDFENDEIFRLEIDPEINSGCFFDSLINVL